ADVAERVLDLVAQHDQHRDDHHGDQHQDHGVLNHALTTLATDQTLGLTPNKCYEMHGVIVGPEPFAFCNTVPSTTKDRRHAGLFVSDSSLRGTSRLTPMVPRSRVRSMPTD